MMPQVAAMMALGIPWGAICVAMGMLFARRLITRNPGQCGLRR